MGALHKLTVIVVLACSGTSAGAESFVLRNGLWFDGETFVERSMFVSGEAFVEEESVAPDALEIDLQGKYLIPPLADAHAHVFFDADTYADDVRFFYEQGVQYVLVQDTIIPPESSLQTLLNEPGRPDFKLTYGILTTRFSGYDLPGSPMVFVDDVSELEARWPDILSRKLDFLKVIVAFSEEQEARAADPDGGRTAGVSPATLKRIVELAHQANIPVSAHIETAADFRAALDANVDYIAHMPASWRVEPGPGDRQTGFPDADPAHWLLTPEDARRAALLNIPVITTTFRDKEAPRYSLHAEIMRRNLHLLAERDARIILGTDFGGQIVDEIEHVAELTELRAARLVRMATMDTSKAIFPGRRIGDFKPGAEATFLVLAGDPIQDLSALRRVEWRMVKGDVFDREPTTAMQEQGASAQHYEAQAITDDVFLLRIPGSPFSDNIGVVVTGDGPVLIDSGYLEEKTGILEALAVIDPRPPRYLILTHFHHAGGHGIFPDATIIAQRKAAARMTTRQMMYGAMPLGPFDNDELPDLLFDKEKSLDYGGKSFVIRHAPNGHTDGDAVIFLREPAVVFTGDVFVTGLGVIDYANGGCLDGYSQALRMILEHAPDNAQVVPGHGAPGTRADIAEFSTLLDDEIRRIRSSIAAGHNEQRIKAEAPAAEWTKWEAMGIGAGMFMENLLATAGAACTAE